MCAWIAETCMTARNKHNVSSWVSPTNIAKVIWRRRSRRYRHYMYIRSHAAVESELAVFVESSWTLSSQLYSSASEFSSVKVSRIFEVHVVLYKPIYGLVRDRYSTFPLLGVSSPWLLLAVSVTRHFQLLAITRRFLYSTYPTKDITCIFTQRFHYSTFQLLAVSALPLRTLILYRNIVDIAQY